MVVPALQIFNGGQMTDLPVFTGAYDPTALVELVSPGNVNGGANYSVTLALLSAFVAAGLSAPTIITAGATLGLPYVALTTDFRVLLNKTIASASYVNLGSAVNRAAPIMVRDLKGDANVNSITVSFTGTCDGLASPIVIDAPYGGWTFNPLPNGNWYLTNT